MCGIAGLLSLRGEAISPVTLKNMTDAIAHRGPDGEGQWIDGPVGLGHRRLAIIDPSPAGHQPMMSDDQRYVLSYNGEIYNFRELRTELETAGYKFRSQTDSEVVLYALALWGKDALLKFNGMFALALWDRQESTLLLARDRYGVKPLYFARQGHNFSFGSEQKAILQGTSFKKDLNAPALLEYLTFQNIFTQQTLIKDISLLPAGGWLDISLENACINTGIYWDYQFSTPDEVVDRSEYVEELGRLFEQAVNRQLVSDVELGAFLSGGIDSGSISAVAAKTLPNLKSFTVGFDLSSASGLELGFDERSRAELMSSRFRTEHYQMVLKSGDMERCFSDLVWHLEEPRVGQSYPNYYAAKLASKFVKVVLAGTGGDELFGGYPWRYYRTANAQNFDEYVDNYYQYWQRLVPNTEINALFEPISSSVEGVWTKDIFREVFLNHENELSCSEDYINHSLYFEAKTFLHGLLVVEDKLSMAHGLESRVPFMDNDLVDFAMKCPVGLKLNNLSEVVRMNENMSGGKQNKYFEKTNDGKQILRDIMSQYLPDDIYKAEKKGFSSPDASWFKGESIDFVKTLLTKDNMLSQILDYNVVNRLVNEHFTGKRNRRLLIWSLISCEQYLRQNF